MFPDTTHVAEVPADFSCGLCLHPEGSAAVESTLQLSSTYFRFPRGDSGRRVGLLPSGLHYLLL
jgi:hypothetical protein